MNLLEIFKHLCSLQYNEVEGKSCNLKPNYRSQVKNKEKEGTVLLIDNENSLIAFSYTSKAVCCHFPYFCCSLLRMFLLLCLLINEFEVEHSNSHTAAIAAGNNGIPVRMHGYEFGKASGMAPRARYISFYFLWIEFKVWLS